ncbi:PQQ-dependent sugar dehydrogenase [Methylobacter tundripaludum]|uniref:L-sorbosone dehydrogenase, putative n=1 Tax=Methylobacter tundripaludum (strain ATCC BAA-1195 / DSM 17260 / SV96) TaxID=697282 RepID=G3J1W7_METTV|nr:sorbosone dehydrogenase family protein [Methylobacter tundripaludum]EGW19723.1 L-sorbosone dehydrogenase, putative [Methylobacter tundripaludum SV96]
MHIKTILLALFLINPCLAVALQNSHQNIIKQLHVPAGFTLSIFADNLPNARSLALGDNGTVFVGTGSEGSVYAVQDSNSDGVADKSYVIASHLYMPNGVAYRDDSLYVAEVNRIIRFDRITQQLANPPKPVVVYDQFPSEQHHGWKYLRFGPDNKLYTSVGAPCNICEPEKPIYSSLVRLNADGSGFEILARGIRSSVGFDWQPETNSLFFTDNGRDYLGDDLPPDELNQWTTTGEHFGFPYCHGGDIPDPEFSADKKCRQFTAPVWKFKAHMAPLGLRFYRGKQFSVEYKNQLFVAEHGSWNRSEPQGYRVALVKFKQGKPVSEQVFIDGWLTKDDKVLGRPVDILEMPDGSLLISDDKLGVIYRVEYKGNHG